MSRLLVALLVFWITNELSHGVSLVDVHKPKQRNEGSLMQLTQIDSDKIEAPLRNEICKGTKQIGITSDTTELEVKVNEAGAGEVDSKLAERGLDRLSGSKKKYPTKNCKCCCCCGQKGNRDGTVCKTVEVNPQGGYKVLDKRELSDVEGGTSQKLGRREVSRKVRESVEAASEVLLSAAFDLKVKQETRVLDKTDETKEIDGGISQQLETRGGIRQLFSFSGRKKSLASTSDGGARRSSDLTNRLAAPSAKSTGSVEPPRVSFPKPPSPPAGYPREGVRRIPSERSALGNDGNSPNYRNQRRRRVRHHTTSRGGDCNCHKACQSFCQYMCCCWLFQACSESCGGSGGGGGDPCGGDPCGGGGGC